MENEKRKVGVLFVCLGNICRSPMAEAVFRHLVNEAGFSERFVIDSAGTGNWHTGNPPHHGTRRILDQYGISYEGLKARQVAQDDFAKFDYIIAMDNQNERDLKALARKTNARIVKLLDLVPESQLKEVPDPYYTGNFEEVYGLVQQGCRALLELIRQEHALG
ncbi:low molecular weight protein-tyrosine-phosphatase PtpA [Paenibacillus sp. oral taxon 786 str. D14]|uniref:low molecular weight protein-tyrosine-phosphatase n=1 Tax=unclassified Paenibacillus TaxID=185978 RepID=UPI0001AFCD15|nr:MULTISPECIES: low molecular weight protein-tyrosine-phosphatase [unclassified Paenibacillus]EES73663.1 low molecular weight protein-tyrosine-phosphatase PtpA [Paenibacillus sp. oral taxon 786 str. D14]MCT2193678.1 low molecular weight phosphotyrosine protein phosphatase [Paenibacillus sp. p3-SID1389]